MRMLAVLLLTSLSAHAAAPAVTRFVMKNVDFHVDDSIVLRLKHLEGSLLPTKKGMPPTFDDKRSFVLDVEFGEVSLDAAALSDLMNRHVLNYAGSPLKDVRITIEGGHLKQKGTLHKGVVAIPFELEGKLEPTPQGQIRLRTTGIHSAHLPVKGLMELFGVKVAKLMKGNEARGLGVDKNDIILFPDRMIPAPQMRGKVTAVRIEGDRIVQTFGSAPARRAPEPSRAAANYMYFRGGILRFGKLTMTDADLEIVDADPKDPLDFFLDHYNAQLVAGYSKNLPNLGLVVSMPDYAQVAKPVERPATAP